MKIGKDFERIGEIDTTNPHLLEIGDYCILGGESKIILHCPIRCYTEDPRVVLEDLVWIGFRSLVLPSTFIGRCSIIGANSVVFGRVEPYSIYAGNKTIRKREIGELLNYFILRRLQKPKQLLGVKPTNWKLLNMNHVKYLLGYNTVSCYDRSIDFNLTISDFISKYASNWVEKTSA